MINRNRAVFFKKTESVTLIFSSSESETFINLNKMTNYIFF